MDGQTDRRTDERTNERPADERTAQRTIGRTDGRIDGRMYGRTVGRTHASMHAHKHDQNLAVAPFDSRYNKSKSTAIVVQLQSNLLEQHSYLSWQDSTTTLDNEQTITS